MGVRRIPADQDQATEAGIEAAFGAWLEEFRDGFPGTFDQDDMEAAFRAGWLRYRAGQPSDEDKIRDAMTEATEHPGRIVTR